MKRMLCLLLTLVLLSSAACAESLTTLEEFVLSFVLDADPEAQWSKSNGLVDVNFTHKNIPSNLRIRDLREGLRIEFSPYSLLWVDELQQYHSVRYAVENLHYDNYGVLQITFEKEQMYPALIQRGKMYRDEHDYAMAARYFKTAAEYWDEPYFYAEVCNVCDLAGEYTEASRFAELGAAMYNFDCMYYLAALYSEDWKNDESAERAIELYAQLADFGEDHACYLLYDLYAQLGNEEQSEAWLKKGAEMGSAACLDEMAFRYQDTDHEKYIAYLQAAEKEGAAFAAMYLAREFAYCDEHRDIDQAIYYYVREFQQTSHSEPFITLEELLSMREEQ